MVSPRAWGWTGSKIRRGGRKPGLPTSVGVDGKAEAIREALSGSPHERGGGRIQSENLCRSEWVSPRAWGWTTICLVIFVTSSQRLGLFL